MKNQLTGMGGPIERDQSKKSSQRSRSHNHQTGKKGPPLHQISEYAGLFALRVMDLLKSSTERFAVHFHLTIHWLRHYHYDVFEVFRLIKKQELIRRRKNT